MAYHFRNLVFEGGGVKGIAYMGALRVLEANGILGDLKRVGGTSAGAITALLLGLNYTLAEIEKILVDLDFNRFLDDSRGLMRDAKRLMEDFGWFKGDFFRDWAADLIKTKTGNSEATFNDIDRLAGQYGFKRMYFSGTNLSTGFSEVFSVDHTPRLCVADAVRISMSIPLFFAAKRGLRGDVYVDGGLLDNYPVKLFDREKYVENFSTTPAYYASHNASLDGRNISDYVYNQETLGFRLDSGREIAVFRDQAEPVRYNIDSFYTYARSLITTILESQQNQHLHEDDWHRTIYIDTLGVGTTDFDLGQEKKLALIDSGRKGAEAYFEWYNTADCVLNRPDK